MRPDIDWAEMSSPQKSLAVITQPISGSFISK